ncbi:MAG: VWA domain-containing protein [Pyrinomonadaceae bacterium]
MNRKSTTRSRRPSAARLNTFPLRATLAQVLALLLILQTCMLPSAAVASPTSPARTAPPPAAEVVVKESEAAGETFVVAAAAAQSFGVVLTELSTDFRGHVGLDHHQPTNRLVLSANAPTGEPHSFEQIGADGSHAAFSNLAGLVGEQRVAAARDDGQGQSLAGFAPGELFVGTGAPGVIARVRADGASVQNPWVTLPGEAGAADGGLYLDRTGAFGGDLLAVTSAGGVWRVNSVGVPTLLTNLGTPLRGVTTVPEDPDRHGPWAGKVLVGAPEQGTVYSIDLQGNSLPYQLGVSPEDFRVVPAHENFYGVDADGRKLWGAKAAAFAGMVGDVLVAQKSPGTLSRVHWNGTEFQVSPIAEVTGWRQITFSPAGVAPVEAVRQVYDKIAVVRHAPVLNSGRVEGALWQLTGEAVTLDGTDTITSDLLIPGAPTVSVQGTGGKFSFGGVIEGPDAAEPTGYAVTLTGNATLRHLITRTNPVEIDGVEPPPAPAGARDVTLTQAGQSAGDWATVRALTVQGKAGSVTVPAGTYGAFSASSHTTLVFGVAGATTPAVYNLDSLSLSGGSQLRVAGPVVLTVRNGITLSGSTLGAGDEPRRLLLKMSGGELKITGSGVLYGVVRAPQSAVTVEGQGRLRGTVACDRLTVSGNGVLQITENDLPPPPVNRPPEVEAGGDQTITLPADTVALQGTAADDGLPEGSALTYQWSKVSGPAAVVFDSPRALASNVTFTQPGTYVLRLTASDSLLTASDELTITVIPRNQPPTVEAGPEQSITLPAAATLAGVVTDDGLPRGVLLSVAWSVVEGPGAVTFADPAAAATAATFAVAGRYTLRLTANDTEFTVFDDTVVEVRSANLTPEVSAGPDQMITPPNNTIRLNGVATDDGRPSASALSVKWTQVSGPAEVVFGDSASAVTTATFSDQGAYVLRLTANDTEFTVSDEVEVVVGCPDNLKNLDVVLVIDRSGSMAGARLASAKAAAKSFVDNLQLATDQVGIVSFSSGGQLNQPLTHDGARAKAAIDSLGASGGTNIGSGITSARIELTGVRHNPNSAPIMILLSDGENSAGDFVGPANTAKAAGIRVITIGIAGAAPAQMRSIASSPNDFYFAPTSEDLEWIYAVIAGSVCRNVAPLVRAGDDFEVTLPNTATLGGDVRDDGLPANSRLTSIWSVVSGPGPVDFFDASAVSTNAVFSAPGSYVLRLSASDTSLTTTDDVAVTVRPEPSLEGSSLTLAPAGPTTNQIGVAAALTARLLNAAGEPIPNFAVRFNASGPNATTGTLLTDATGAANFSYTGTNTGADSVQAVAQGSASSVASNPVELTWTLESPTPNPSPTPTPIPSTTGGWIGGPAHQSTVTGVVPVTLGPGVTLTQGTVQVCPAATPSACTTLNASASGGPGETVASFDTTTVANGSYVIRLQGTDAEGRRLLSLVLVTVAGENKPGRMKVSVTDVTVPVAGLPITVGRSYDSLDRGRVGDFGYGWSLALGSPRLEVSPANDVTLTEPGTGRRVTFKFTPRSFGGFMGFWHYPAYTPEPGVYGKLSGDGCGLMVNVSGGFRCFFGEQYKPGVYTYTDPQGSVYTMGGDGRLKTVKDLTGNTLTFTPNGITSSAGDLAVPFARDAQGRITQITDTTGRIFRYAYDAAGNLSSVTLPGVTTPATYTYDPTHLFLTGKDPRGNVEQAATYHADGRLASATDAAGNTTRYEYDVALGVTRQINPDGGFELAQTDASGLLLSQTNALGQTTRFTYDANRNKLTETDALGQTTRFTYDSSGNMTSVVNPQGRTIRGSYNQYGQPVTDADALGNTRTVLYDANSSPVSVSDGVGVITSFSYDRFGNPITQTDGVGQTTHLTYDAYGNVLTRTDALGRTTSNTYDLMGRLLTVTDPRGGVTRNTYDPLGRLLTVTDALNRVTRYEYDGNGNRTAMVDANTRRTTYTYDAANRLTRVDYPNSTFITHTYNYRDQRVTTTDESGRTTRFEYDLAGRLVKTVHPGNAEETVAYDAIGRVTARTDERGATTRYEYDPSCGCSDRVTKVTDAKGRVTQYAYDDAGRRVSFTDANNVTTRYKYDARHRLVETAFADGTSVKLAYDGADNVVAATDQSGRVTRYAYDGAGDLASVTDALNQTTAYAYDATRNLLTQTDALNRVTRFQYDAVNRPTRRTLPLGQFETFTYDNVGNLRTRVNFTSQTTTYNYDARDRLISKVPAAALGEPTVSYTYTPTGRRATMTDASGATTYSYDARDRLTSKQTPQGTLAYTYDSADNVLTVRSSNAGGVSVDYAYDALGRMESVTDNRPGAGTTSYTYDAVGNLTSVTLPNGVRSDYDYNSINRLTTLTSARGGGVLASYAYAHTPTGQRLSVTEHTGRSVTYAYDAINRLVGETVAGAPDPAQNGEVGYTLDAVGNRTARSSTLAGVPAAANTFDANDRAVGDTYDANGNTLAAGGRTFAYDFEDRLKSADGGAVTVVYDGDGNRAAKTAGGVTTRYLVDTQSPTGYAQVVEEVVGGETVRAYTYGLDLVSQSLRTEGGWATSFYGYDGQGSVRYLTDSAGVVTDTYDYDAFGNLVAQTGSTPNNYLFRGEQFDADLGAYFLRARYYDQRRGRFLSADTFEGFADEPLSLHKYLYANADPVNNSDPSGYATMGDYARFVLIFVIRIAPRLRPIARQIICIFLTVASWLGPELALPASLIEFAFCRGKRGAPRRGGETPATKAGRQAHRDYNPGPDYSLDRPLKSGRRPDAVDYGNKVVRELKPNNPRAVRRGERQVDRYRDELQREHGGDWKRAVDTYEPDGNGGFKYTPGKEY